MKWWQNTVVYELYPKSFKDTSGSGSGDLKGIIQELDYLSSLGIGAIWITPVFRSPMVDNGYDVSDYYSIDPSYGTMEDMEALFKEAEKRNIRIVLDLVFNHTSDQNEWFLTSKKDRTNDKADWYIWRDAKEDGTPPTNWRGIFGGSAWEWCEERQQYYLHTFAVQQPDLNWANPEVRKELYKVANFWIDKGAGGFRIDAITYVRKPDVFTDGKPDGEDGLVSVHDMTANTPGILDYLYEFRRNVSDGKDIFTVSEANGVKPDELSKWVGKDGAFDMLFEFSHVNLEFKGVETWCRPDPWTPADLKAALRASQQATKDNGWYPIFFENHDKPRCISHYFPDDSDQKTAAKAIGVILYTLRGTPFLYQGQELGYDNVAWDSIDLYNDISSYGQYDFALEEGFSAEEALACVHRFSRDNSRTPMQWDDSPNAGFSTGDPWLPVHPGYQTENVEAEAKDPDSVLNWYRSLAELRKNEPVLAAGDFIELYADDPDLFAYRRCSEDAELITIVNFSDHEVPYRLPDEKQYRLVMSSLAHCDGNMAPYEACIFKAV